MFPGPAQRKQIDKIGQIFSGFLSTRFLGPNPSNIWTFEKWKQYCWQVFFACLFLVRSPQNKPKQLYYVAQFPMASPSKKKYIYYICSIFLPQIFPRPAFQKNKHMYIYIYICFFCSVFFRRFFRSQPSLPTPKKKHTFCSFFCRRFARGQPSKKYKSKKNKNIFFQFCNRWFSRHQPSKK